VSDDNSQDPTIDRRRGGALSLGDLPEGMEVGEYRVIRKVGEGGMGAVYSAVQPVIGKRVAIKVLAPHIAKNPELVRRFVDEARAVNKIGHPNIVDIFSFGWLPDQRHYFAMEFLDGESLADRMKRGSIPAAERRRLLRQICQALEAAHRQGIVHRDLKPDNIWVVKPQHGDTFAKLLDFGIAKLIVDAEGADAVEKSHRTQTGVVMGTPAYMSPEQCRGVAVDHRTDIYALGMILYEMFAGRLPFEGSFAELLTHHLMSVPPPLAKFARVPPALDRLVQSCLEKDPAQRPQSAEALGRALEAALPGDDEAALAATPMAMAAPVAASAVPGESAASEPQQPDTLAPAMGHTVPPVRTQVPARDRKPLVAVALAIGVAAIVAVVLSTRRHDTAAGPVATADARLAPASAPPAVPAVAEPAPPAAGSAHIVLENATGARVLVDGKLVAAGAHEVRIPRLAADQPHHLRVEGPGLAQPYERTFTVAAGAEVELAVASPAPVPPAESRPHTARHREGATSASGASPKPHHRDGLVGDDIFNSKP
jgi:serine/threonine-protein kinase